MEFNNTYKNKYYKNSNFMDSTQGDLQKRKFFHTMKAQKATA